MYKSFAIAYIQLKNIYKIVLLLKIYTIVALNINASIHEWWNYYFIDDFTVVSARRAQRRKEKE